MAHNFNTNKFTELPKFNLNQWRTCEYFIGGKHSITFLKKYCKISCGTVGTNRFAPTLPCFSLLWHITSGIRKAVKSHSAHWKGLRSPTWIVHERCIHAWSSRNFINTWNELANSHTRRSDTKEWTLSLLLWFKSSRCNPANFNYLRMTNWARKLWFIGVYIPITVSIVMTAVCHIGNHCFRRFVLWKGNRCICKKLSIRWSWISRTPLFILITIDLKEAVETWKYTCEL